MNTEMLTMIDDDTLAEVSGGTGFSSASTKATEAAETWLHRAGDRWVFVSELIGAVGGVLQGAKL